MGFRHRAIHKRVKYLVFSFCNVFIFEQIGIILGLEGVEWRWDVLWADEQAVELIRHFFSFDVITAESGTHRSVALLPAREVCLGKLRSLSADGSIDGEHNASVCLLEVQ